MVHLSKDISNPQYQSLKDLLTLSPIQKYQLQNKFPWNMFVQIALLIFVSYEAVIVSDYNQKFSNKQYNFFKLQLAGMTNFVQSNQIFTVVDLENSLSKIFTGLTQIQQFGIQEIDVSKAEYYTNLFYQFPSDQNDNQFIYKLPTFDFETFKNTLQITSSSSFRDLFSELAILEIQMNSIKTFSVQSFPTCWNISNIFTFNELQVDQSLKLRPIDCSFERQITNDNYDQERATLGLFFFIVVLAIISLILNIKEFLLFLKLYSDNTLQAKRRLMKQKQSKQKQAAKSLKLLLLQQEPWENLSFEEKMHFIDMYLPLILFGNFLSIFTNGYILYLSLKSDSLQDGSYDFIILVGFQAFLQWITLLKLTSFYDQISLMTHVFYRSTPRVLQCVVGFMPVFFGYAILGYSCFYECIDFKSFSSSCGTLFYIIFQDAVIQHINTIAGVSTQMIAFLYLGSYVLVLVLTFINILVAIFTEELSQRNQAMQEEKELMNQIEQPVQKEEDLNQRKNMNISSIINAKMKRKTIVPSNANITLSINSNREIKEKERESEKEKEKDKERESIQAGSIPDHSSQSQKSFRNIRMRALDKLSNKFKYYRKKGELEKFYQEYAKLELKLQMLQEEMEWLVLQIFELADLLETEFKEELQIEQVTIEIENYYRNILFNDLINDEIEVDNDAKLFIKNNFEQESEIVGYQSQEFSINGQK